MPADPTPEATTLLRARLRTALRSALRRAIGDATAALAAERTPQSIPQDRWDHNRAVWVALRDQATRELRDMGREER